MNTVNPQIKLDIFKQNMAALYQHYPELAKRVEELKDTNRFKLQDTRLKGVYSIYDRKTNCSYYSIQDPINDVRKQLEALKLKNTKLALFLGFGLGYELIYYLQKMLRAQDTLYILVIEKEIELFKLAMQNVNLVNIISNKGITLIIGQDEAMLFPMFHEYLIYGERITLIKAVNPVYMQSSLIINKEYYLQAMKAFREAGIQGIQHYGNDPYDSLIGIENMLANLGEIVKNPGINLLQNKFAGKPGIVIASGPSLNKNKHLLKGLEDKAVFVCADSTLKILNDYGIKPHLVASLERIPPTVTVMTGFAAEDVDEVYYAACPVVPPGAYEVYPGPRIIVYRNFRHFDWLGIKRGTLKILYSSGNMAFKLAEALGCDPIILVGQDLAFSRDGYTHAEGYLMGEKQGAYFQRQAIEVMGNDGQPILTEASWYSCIKAYEMDIANCQARVINSTEGGAFLQGSIVMPLQESLSQYISEPFYPRRKIKEFLNVFTKKDIEDDIVEVKRKIEDTIIDMEEVVELCRQGLAVCTKYKGKLQNALRFDEGCEKIAAELPKIRTKVFKARENIFYKENVREFFFHVIQSYAIRHDIERHSIPGRSGDINRATVETILMQEEWYAVIGDLASICIVSLRKAYEDLKEL